MCNRTKLCGVGYRFHMFAPANLLPTLLFFVSARALGGSAIAELRGFVVCYEIMAGVCKEASLACLREKGHGQSALSFLIPRWCGWNGGGRRIGGNRDCMCNQHFYKFAHICWQQ